MYCMSINTYIPQVACGPVGILSGSKAPLARFGSAIAPIGDIDKNGVKGKTMLWTLYSKVPRLRPFEF